MERRLQLQQQVIWSVFLLFGWRFVFGIIMRWEGREPFLSDAITTLGSNKAACLLRLNFAKVSSTKDLLNRQTCEGILCLRLVTSQYPPGRIPSDSYSHTILRVSPVPCCGVMMCVATVPLSPARSDCLALSFRRHPASRHLIEATTSLQAPVKHLV